VTSEVDDALVTLLAGDATLTTLLGGAAVYFGAAPEQLERFVLVTQQAHLDEPMFGATAYEVITYLVKAVIQAAEPADAEAAAARIDVLLAGQDLALSSYSLMVLKRLQRVRYVDPDEFNRPWQHQGGEYEVWVSPLAIA
jgi:hypothetical protein